MKAKTCPSCGKSIDAPAMTDDRQRRQSSWVLVLGLALVLGSLLFRLLPGIFGQVGTCCDCGCCSDCCECEEGNDEQTGKAAVDSN